MRKYGSIGIRAEGGSNKTKANSVSESQQPVPSIHEHQTPRINNMIDLESLGDEDTKNERAQRMSMIQSTANLDGTPSLSSNSDWYKNFANYGGNDFVSAGDNSGETPNDFPIRRRCNVPLWITFVIMSVLIGSYYAYIRNASLTDIEQTTSHSRNSHVSLQDVTTKSTTVDPGANSVGSNPSTGTEAPANSQLDYSKDEERLTECSAHLECKSLHLNGNCCPTEDGVYLNCCS